MEAARRHPRIGALIVRRPVLSVFVVALSVRASASILFRVTQRSVLFLDDGGYLRLIEKYALGGRAQLSVNQRGFWDGMSSFLQPLGWIGRHVTADPLVMALATGLAGSSVAALTAALVKRRLGVRFALVSGLVVALMPSQILWSSLILRDAYSWLALAVIAYLVGTSGPNWRRGAAWLAVPVALMYLDGIRGHTFMVASIASASAFLFAFRRHPIRLLIGILLLVAVVTATGTVDRGISFFKNGTSGREEALTESVDAGKTTIACVVLPFVYEAPSDGAGWSSDLQCLPSGLRMMLFDPLPNQLEKSKSLIPAFAENVLWYPLLFLSALGLRRMKRWQPQDVFVLVSGAGILVMWAMVDRNFGTAYRHRGEFFWAVAYFAAIGLHHTVMERAVKPGSISGRIRARLVPDEPRCSHRSR